MSYRVRVEKDELVFSAAHFITFDGAHCERLHGHNYRVAVEVGGALDANQYVVDFLLVRRLAKQIVDELDHRMLLPAAHPLIAVQVQGDEVEARFEDRRWVFPRGDCVLLPIANTTSELLARYIAERLAPELAVYLGKRPESLRVEIDECFGHVAICDWD